MNAFLKTYLFVLLLGSALVYVGVPWLGRLGQDAPEAATGRWIWRTPVAPSRTGVPSGHETAAAVPRLTPLPMRQAAAPVPPHHVDASDLPSVSADSTESFWGVVRNQTRCYNLEGEFLRTLPAGVLVEYSQSYPSSAGEVAKCRVRHADGRWIPDVMIPLQALVRFSGDSSAVAEAVREAVRRYFEIKGGLEDFEADLERQARQANPHREDYRRVVAELRAFQEEARELTRQRDAASGELRMQLADRLRTMQAEGIRLRERWQSTQERYQSWQPPIAPAQSARNDPQYRLMQAELERIAPEAKKILGET